MVSDKALLDDIERLANVVGQTPRVKDVRKHGKHSATAYYNHFESWGDALEKAGFEPTEKSVKAECHYCSDEITMPRNRVRKQKRVFCEGCTEKWRSERWQGEKNPNWSEKTDVECDNCGKAHSRLPYRLKNRERYFCEIECLREYARENYGMAGNPNWRGGATMFTQYGPRWEKIREQVISDQNGCCRACGRSREEFDRDLHVHHIKPIRKFEDRNGNIDWESANTSENLVALCMHCHFEWEGLPVLPNCLEK